MHACVPTPAYKITAGLIKPCVRLAGAAALRPLGRRWLKGGRAPAANPSFLHTALSNLVASHMAFALPAPFPALSLHTRHFAGFASLRG